MNEFENIEYELTPLIGPMRILHQWTDAHYDSVLRARKAFDAITT